MQYRELVKSAPKVSLLGFGCMRFITKGGQIDKETTFQHLKQAYDLGVNYFDTAYFYHNGKSEVILGEFIKQYCNREQVYIADKLPGFMVTKSEQIEKYFNTQLKRLNTNYIDYYLMHMLDSMETWNRLKKLGVIDFIEEKKKIGQIKHIGFSFHGRVEDFIEILEDYKWDFCQIQYNYLDENYQAGVRGLKRANELGLGVIIMEPLRGGSLAQKAPDQVNNLFAKFPQKRSAAHWSFRWIMNQPEVSVVLSGMNDSEHIEENVKVSIESTIGCMSEEETTLIKEVVEIYRQVMKVPCTGCNYCMPCPFGVDIPTTFADYNAKYFARASRISRFQYLARCEGVLGNDKSGADLCDGCNKCISHCPQNIAIPQKLKEAHKSLNSKFIRFGIRLVKPLMGRKK